MSVVSLSYEILGTVEQEDSCGVRFRFGSNEYWLEMKRHEVSGYRVISLYKDCGGEYMLVGAKTVDKRGHHRVKAWLKFMVNKIKQFCKTGGF